MVRVVSLHQQCMGHVVNTHSLLWVSFVGLFCESFWCVSTPSMHGVRSEFALSFVGPFYRSLLWVFFVSLVCGFVL